MVVAVVGEMVQIAPMINAYGAEELNIVDNVDPDVMGDVEAVVVAVVKVVVGVVVGGNDDDDDGDEEWALGLGVEQWAKQRGIGAADGIVELPLEVVMEKCDETGGVVRPKQFERGS